MYSHYFLHCLLYNKLIIFFALLFHDWMNACVCASRSQTATFMWCIEGRGICIDNRYSNHHLFIFPLFLIWKSSLIIFYNSFSSMYSIVINGCKKRLEILLRAQLTFKINGNNVIHIWRVTDKFWNMHSICHIIL